MSTLSEQREAIEECLSYLGTVLDERESYSHINEALILAKAGCTSIAWIERRQELVRALYKLEQDAPEMAKLFEAFPGSEFAEVRRV